MRNFIVIYIFCATLLNFFHFGISDPILGVLLDTPVCEDTAENTIIGTFSVSNGEPPYQFTILTPEFSAYVEMENEGVVTSESGTIDVKLIRQFDRESLESGEFTVTVVVIDERGASSNFVDQRVIVGDANDNDPVFLNIPYTGSVYEYPWTVNLTIPVEVRDDDDGVRGAVSLTMNSDKLELVYVGGKDTPNLYNLLLNPGVELDYEQSPVITADIIATDGGGGCSEPKEGERSTTTTAVINVEDCPNKAPVFATFYDVELKESSPVNTPVVTVQAIDRDYILNWDMTYSITSTGAVRGWFNINANTGLISVADVIDREDADSLSNDGIIRLEVKATEVVPNGYHLLPTPEFPFPLSVKTNVTIRITDINDNGPTFYDDSTGTRVEQREFETTMDENTPNQISVPGLSIFVQDKDINENAVFSLTNDGDVFEVFPALVSREANVILVVIDSSKLDFEETKTFTVQIVATETQTTEGRAATATITVKLNDTNDNSPEFENSVLSANVSEGANIGDEIIQVHAEDKDSGIYQEITYSLPESDIFAIDEATGIITLQQKLDREQLGSYFLTVIATDGGGRSTNANLQMAVVDVNDHKPIFQRSSYTGTVRENNTEFQSLLEITATDNDQQNTPNSKIEFSIIDGDLKEYFSIISNDSNSVVSVGTVIVAKPIDLESLGPDLIVCTDSAIETVLTVKAEDKGNPSLSSTVALTIIVEDVNDVTPVFNQSEYRASVEELSNVATPVLQVFATDGDVCKPNNDVIYEIDPLESTDISNSFKMNAQTGELTVGDPTLNRDDNATYRFKVRAFDVVGEERNVGEAMVVIELIDINDKPPRFVSNRSVNIEEEQSTGTVVWIVEATDTDLDSDLYYSKSNIRCYKGDIEDILNCVDPFTMENEMQVGNLEVSSRIDRETFSRYTIQITVEDLNAGTSGTSDQSVSEIFNVHLTDINDNSPSFNPNQDDFEIVENSVNVLVGQVVASDEDEGDNAVVTYSVAEEDAQYVTIDPVTGIITSTSNVNKSIDREEIGNYLNVTIIASDGASPPLTNSTILSIRIIDVNDEPPVFVGDPYSGIVSENATEGEVVVVVNATDEDEGGSSQIKYDITKGDQYGRFSISSTVVGDVKIGIITVSQLTLDREDEPSYTLTVRATDGGGLFAEATVNIEVTDVNDKDPEFPADLYTAIFLEDSAVGKEVDSLVATDGDEGMNAEIEYFIINDEKHFIINRSTGIVSLYESIRNGEEEYVVEVMGQDKGVPPRSSTYVLEIAVEDVNLNTPKFVDLPPDGTVLIKEGLPSGTPVYQVNATDRDRGENGKIRYTLEDAEDAFYIEEVTGWIISKERFDRETLDHYEVTVTASDSNQDPRSASASFTIYIDDVDDNDPHYPSDENEQVIEEVTEGEQTEPLNIKVKQANDEDDPDNAVNYYFIIGGSAADFFELDSSSRLLTLTTPLDREELAERDLVVTVVNDPDYQPPAEDVTWESVSNDDSMLHVIINVGDINDNSPQFEKTEYYADIPLNSQANPEAVITQVLATDADVEENAEVEYAVDSAVYTEGGVIRPADGVFGIQLARDDIRGDLYLAEDLTGGISGEYTVTVSATDGVNPKTTTIVRVGIIDANEAVTLYSSIPLEDFDSPMQDQFASDLGALLEALVIVDNVIAHVKEEDLDLAQTDITFHAKEFDSTELVKRDDIINKLSEQESSQFLNVYGIVDVQSNVQIVDRTQEYLTAGLIIAGSLVLVIIVCFTIAIICMRRKYNRKLRVAEATTSAAHEMADTNNKLNVPVLPNTNDYAGGENPLFTENQKNAIDLDGFLTNQESQDDDDEIDDNAVDSQDSAIAVNMFGSMKSKSDDGQDLEEGQFDIDFNRGDNARLAAALNAANERRGGENLTYIFDQGEDNTTL